MNYVLGFPRIGERRELKKALESFWSKKITQDELQEVANELKKRHWQYQKDAGIDIISSNDFSYYDLMLDASIMLNAIPKRFQDLSSLEQYFSMARGNKNAVAMEMTKWFNTNYHFIVPEITKDIKFKLNAEKIINEYNEAKKLGIKTKINLIGPITYLALSKGDEPLSRLDEVVSVYEELLEKISSLDENIIVQFDEPIFVTDVQECFYEKLKSTYDKLSNHKVKVLVVSYFESAVKFAKVLCDTKVWAIGLDFIYGSENLQVVDDIARVGKILFAGVIDGRNIWRADFETKKLLAQKIAACMSIDKVYFGSSCSLLHVPVTLKYEKKMNKDVKSWLSFATEKLDEIALFNKMIFDKNLTKEDKEKISKNKKIINSRKESKLVHDSQVTQRLRQLTKFSRECSFEQRNKIQREDIDYPSSLPTTTIGSFPQTDDIRNIRRDFKKGAILESEYERAIERYIEDCIEFQEEVGIDVLVHGEPERNDMVEYFGEQMKGFVFSQSGWVQSYGSRCVKPPIIYGDVSREQAMSVRWISYAQSLTQKPVKGMLTGPVTMLNWSFVRDDLPRYIVAEQIALAINDEISDLQSAGIKIIQVDEAAFKEGYPLKKSKIKDYESWAVKNFKIAVSSAKPKTQIHTHMCYSEFNDIIKTIEDMDADVISIETARSGNELLRIFKKVGYKQEVGPGVYDIHSPRIPSVDELKKQIDALIEVLPSKQLWINPDCGLKTRKWEEVKPSLINMVEAVKQVRG